MSRTFGNQGNTGIITAPDYQMYDYNVPKKGQDDTKSNYSYAPKRGLIYNRKGLGSATSKRSKTNTKLSAKAGLMMKEQVGPYVGETVSQKQETKSQLNYIAMKRFNEAPLDDRPKSQVRSIFSRPKSQAGSKLGSHTGRSVFSQQQKKMNIYTAVEKLDDLQLDEISAIISNNRREADLQVDDATMDQDDAAGEEADQVRDLEEDKLTSITGAKPTASMVSAMSGRTYISTLQNQLFEEKEARLKLEGELEELKKISSEITS
jgi:hypothetical protein